jgi:hypothetical protein
MRRKKPGNSPKFGKNFSFRELCSNLMLALGAVTALGNAIEQWGPWVAPYAHLLLATLNSWFL